MTKEAQDALNKKIREINAEAKNKPSVGLFKTTPTTQTNSVPFPTTEPTPIEKPIQFFSTDIKILRQSQSKIALDYCQMKGINLSVEELMRVTDVFVETCLRDHKDEDLKKRIKALDKWISEKQIIS
ncbi:hypothetical protein UFOVP1479_14 [uncultured Caudovirales phage]|uniref:Uncharacterized protein n=1 Tax=uncultured Caudovirales phage TaxID=2100421 RepID=A0A6J5PPJ8_9CAUD|nr:hypothetical protein UFOVP310_16 [uncultured Caudovirales phage]CAB4152725.1 hypothetical protein UFOVP619_33 [uncultured Caudovirales phage]CAB4172927.1 hypothetical protein UFOVP947_17 [uncultured Caudovirales phage]CAB4184741.1 hypothetical protein UFOVP1114_33 [uncultured Caudovirales phage]CAB4204235.1 hypothetical protein UFOVP1386_33 [uncultured Caudovirales phage]